MSASGRKSSKVYFAGLRARGPRENKLARLGKLFETAGFKKLAAKDALTALKLKDLAEKVEAAADALEDVADTVETIVVKES